MSKRVFDATSQSDLKAKNGLRDLMKEEIAGASGVSGPQGQVFDYEGFTRSQEREEQQWLERLARELGVR